MASGIQNPAVTALLLLALFVAAIVVPAIWPSIFATSLRRLFQQWPEARASFIGQGAWISLSKRFGLPWIFALLVAAFAWLLGVMRLVPDTNLGAWLLFGPALALLIVGIGLGALRVMRFIAVE